MHAGRKLQFARVCITYKKNKIKRIRKYKLHKIRAIHKSNDIKKIFESIFELCLKFEIIFAHISINSNLQFSSLQQLLIIATLQLSFQILLICALYENHFSQDKQLLRLILRCNIKNRVN